MANAKKCDRCGTLYEPYGIIDRVRAEKNSIMVIGNIYGEITSRDEFYDLCPDCMEELHEWLKGEKDE